MQPTVALSMQPGMALRAFKPTARRFANPEETHRAHTISQRLRNLKKIPPELIPLGIVVGVAVGAAFYSMGRKFFVDKTMRLSRQNRKE